MEYSSLFISGGANTVKASTIWTNDFVHYPDGILAYLLTNSIVIVDIKYSKVLCTLKATNLKDDPLTSLSSLYDEKQKEYYLFSGSEKGIVNIWKISTTSMNLDSFFLFQSINVSPSISITLLSSLHLSEISTNLFVVSSTNGSVSIYSMNNNNNNNNEEDTNKFNKIQTFKFLLNQLPNSIYIKNFSNNNIFLFIGSVDSRIHFYTSSYNINELINTTNNNENEIKIFNFVGYLTGHDEWINCLTSLQIDNEFYLASSSQDSKIRIWKIIQEINKNIIDTNKITEAYEEDLEEEEELDEIDEEKMKAVPLLEEEVLSSEARLKFVLPSSTSSDSYLYSVYLESLLIGHEDWITSISWLPTSSTSSNLSLHDFSLFSTSMDRNMIIWSSDSSSNGVWLPVVRVGDIGGALGGSVSGNLLGFVSGAVSPRGDAVLGIGYGGSFHFWKKNIEEDIEKNDKLSEFEKLQASQWKPLPFLSGHFNSVNDITWNDKGQYLLSVSSDQTCRLFAPLNTEVKQLLIEEKSLKNSKFEVEKYGDLWKEVSRPQIHGYDLNCIVLNKENTMIYTAGEEKIIRLYSPSLSVIRGLKELCSISFPVELLGHKIEQVYLPELGLSTKGREKMTEEEKKEEEEKIRERGVQEISWNRSPPLDSQLNDYTLWLEMKKMYGHNNEIVAFSMSSCGNYLVSSSKSRYCHNFFILVWSLQTYKVISRLEGHESTAVCLAFSPCGEIIASSGKDRSLCLYKNRKAEGEEKDFSLSLCAKGAHKRIVWDLKWGQDSENSQEKKLFTVGRDGQCKVWSVIDKKGEELELSPLLQLAPLQGNSPITAMSISFQSYLPSAPSSWQLLFGGENGEISVWNFDPETLENKLLGVVPSHYSHTKTIRRIKIRPNTSSSALEFATCGEDNSVRIHSIKFH